ncbi:hypothetical protein TNCV_2889111 [Trichonephila clavipes]|nr:hypothetical protein TNCV_2889111 [Trichonephila clavipes]
MCPSANATEDPSSRGADARSTCRGSKSPKYPVGVAVWTGDASSNVVLVTAPKLKITRSVASNLRVAWCHTPGLALHTTVAGKCPSSPEDEQKQGESRDR